MVKNKYLTRKVLFEAGADDSDISCEVSNIQQIRNLQEHLSYPVMVKPCDGSGSRGVSKVYNTTDLKQACIYAMRSSLSSRAVIEPFINGVEYGVETFVYNGIPYVLAIMKKWMTTSPYYAELGHAIPSGLKDGTEQCVKNAVKNTIKALGITVGAVNMDVLVTELLTLTLSVVKE